MWGGGLDVLGAPPPPCLSPAVLDPCSPLRLFGDVSILRPFLLFVHPSPRLRFSFPFYLRLFIPPSVVLSFIYSLLSFHLFISSSLPFFQFYFFPSFLLLFIHLHQLPFLPSLIPVSIPPRLFLFSFSLSLFSFSLSLFSPSSLFFPFFPFFYSYPSSLPPPPPPPSLFVSVHRFTSTVACREGMGGRGGGEEEGGVFVMRAETDSDCRLQLQRAPSKERNCDVRGSRQS